MSQNKTIQLHVGLHKPFMKAVGDMFKDEKYFRVQAMFFCSLPDEPLSILTGLLNLE